MKAKLTNEYQRFVAQHVSPRARILNLSSCEDILKLSFANGSFDAVVAYDALEKTYDVPKVLSEMQRVLKNGGLLLINSANLLSTRAAIQAYRRRKAAAEKAASGHLVKGVLSNVGRLMARTVAHRPNFLYRSAATEKMFAQSDAVVCLNPVDLKLYLETIGMKIISYQETKHLPEASVTKHLSSRFLAEHMDRIRIVARKGARFERH